MIDDVGVLLSEAGWAGLGLLVVSTLLWSTAATRAAALAKGLGPRFDATALDAPPEAQMAILRTARAQLAEGRDLLRALVASAPLLGLLGTVGGMVELFDGLHAGAQAVGRGSVAGGISTALVTTQLGLVIAVPGLVVARALERRELALVAGLEARLHRRQEGRAQRTRPPAVKGSYS